MLSSLHTLHCCLLNQFVLLAQRGQHYVLLDRRGPNTRYSNRYLSAILHISIYNVYFRQLSADDRPHKTDVCGVLGILHKN